jgi:sulfite reductase (NADPH) flavoprotein alpha-component
MLVNRRLSGPESEKDTRHFELDLTGWGLSFEVGDSVGVCPTNDPISWMESFGRLGATAMNKCRG